MKRREAASRAFPLPRTGNETADGRLAWLATVCDASIGFGDRGDVGRDLMEGTVACTVAGLLRDYAAALHHLRALADVLHDCREHMDLEAHRLLGEKAERTLLDAARDGFT